MAEDVLFQLAAIVILGIAAQWCAWRLGLPSIFVLLIFGILVGPVIGLIQPDRLLGELLLPVIAISVAFILFEGGLSLRISELKATGKVVHRLVTIGALFTWLACSAASYYILNLEIQISLLLGAILVVSGPTVIVPLLRHIKPSGNLASILRWEGILIDPIGAVLAVLVYEAIASGNLHAVTAIAVGGILKTILAGSVIGILGALAIIVSLKRYWVPDFLQNPVTIMIVVIVYTASNAFQAESGLLAVTIMGIFLANQNIVTVRHIIEFKENLRVLLISVLFILLAARLNMSDILFHDLRSIAFLVILILIVRPIAVILSTIGSELNWREVFFISSIAPRGIVAAAVSSVLAIRMSDMGDPQASHLVPITFLVIIGTVIINGLGSTFIARWLRIAEPNPQGVLIVGAHPCAISIAQAIKEAGFKVILVDINWVNVHSARMEGLTAYHGNILTESVLHEIELDGIGRLMAITPNDGVNSLAVINFMKTFDRAELYQLAPHGKISDIRGELSKHLQGRILFGDGVNYSYLNRRFSTGAKIKRTNLTDEFGYDDFIALYKETAVPLFLVTEAGALIIYTEDNKPLPMTGQSIIALVDT